MRLPALLSLVAVATFGCDDDPHDHDHAEDTDAGLAPAPDATEPRPDAPDGCDPTAALPTQWRPIASVSTGAVTTSAAGGTTTALIDATAGGTGGAADNPYVYIDLTSGTRVEVSDVESRDSTSWHLALKRSSIKLNGGDSGPAGVRAASVAAATLAEVTAVPSTLAEDDWATDDCALNTLPGGEPNTVMGAWYDYNPSTHQLLPKAEVWVLDLGGGQRRKLRILSYYGDATNPMRGAVYHVEWAAI